MYIDENHGKQIAFVELWFQNTKGCLCKESLFMWGGKKLLLLSSVIFFLTRII